MSKASRQSTDEVIGGQEKSGLEMGERETDSTGDGVHRRQEKEDLDKREEETGKKERRDCSEVDFERDTHTSQPVTE